MARSARKGGRPRKDGPRTASGRLSRAHKGEARDRGTREFQRKRELLINGSDPALAATASGILVANGFLTPEQHRAALRYAWHHAKVFGKPWAHSCILGKEPGFDPPADETIERAKARLAAMDAKLTLDQRCAVANLACFGFIPQFFYTARLGLRPLPDDEAERQALISGLEAIAD